MVLGRNKSVLPPRHAAAAAGGGRQPLQQEGRGDPSPRDPGSPGLATLCERFADEWCVYDLVLSLFYVIIAAVV